MKKTSEEILNYDISYCNGKYGKETPSIKLSTALDYIKSPRSKSIIESLRSDLKNKDKYKNQLDGFLFTGTFSSRGTANLIKYTSLCVLDFDKLSDEELISLKTFLKNNKFVFAFWDSPSGTGIKGLICFDFALIHNYMEDIPKYHKIAFYQFSEYFNKEYNNPIVKLDSSGNDIPRLCYTSYDPNMVIKDEIECFLIEPKEEKKESKSLQKSKKITKTKTILNEDQVKSITIEKNEFARRKIHSIYKFLKKRNLSITDTYERWYKVGQIIANTFSYNIGKEYFLKFCRLDKIKEKHDEEKSRELIISCYINSLSEIPERLSFNSLMYYAKEKGWNNGKGEIK